MSRKYNKKLWPQPSINTMVALELIMVILTVKEVHTKFIKRGRISIHETTSKGKKYTRGKIYLPNSDDVGLFYQLYEVENLHMVDKHKRHRKGKGYIVFIPK